MVFNLLLCKVALTSHGKGNYLNVHNVMSADSHLILIKQRESKGKKQARIIWIKRKPTKRLEVGYVSDILKLLMNIN